MNHQRALPPNLPRSLMQRSEDQLKKIQLDQEAQAAYEANPAPFRAQDPNTLELGLYGEVGWEIRSQDIANILRRNRGRPVLLNVNSYGGDATDGIAIQNLLRNHQGNVTAVVLGIAASAAQAMIMGADEIVMSLGSMQMVHYPWTITLGNAADHLAAAEELEVFNSSYEDILANRSGKTRQQIATMLGNNNGRGTYLTAQESVDAGFADRIVE